jgi:hypothetical protein
MRFGADGSAEFKGLMTVNEAVRSDRTGGTQACFSARLNGTENAVINANGSAVFSGQVTAGGSWPGDNRTAIGPTGIGITGNGGTANVVVVYNSAAAAPARTIEMKESGSAIFTGTVTSANSFAIQLEADDDTKYDVTTEEYTETETYEVEVPVLRPEGVVGTADLVDEPQTRTVTKEREVTKTREVRTYNGAVLDVKTELQALRSRATQQDETIRLMTTALKGLGVDVSAFPSPEDEKPTTKSRKKK